MAELTVENLHLQYGDNPILKGVTMTLNRGEVVSLLGPSGSGKTTLLRAVAGLEVPHQGSIRIGDKVVFDGSRRIDIPAEARNLGLVFQSYALWPHKTVFDNVAYGLKLRNVGASDVAARVTTALEQLSLGHLAQRFPHQLSGGQQQRVALARALVYNPPVILLDEPLSNLDAKLREEARAWLRELIVRMQLSALCVTHDQGEALVMSDRIAVMNQGRIEQLGDPASIYEAPATRFVAEFIGRMNLFTGTVTAERGVRIGDATFGIEVPPEMPPGAAVHVAIRPERARLSAARPSEGVALAGTVRQVFYLGATREVHVDLAHGEKGFVELRNDGSDAGVQAGSAVWLSAAASNCRVLPAAAPGGRP